MGLSSYIIEAPLLLKDIAFLKVLASTIQNKVSLNKEVQKKCSRPQKIWPQKIAQRIRLGRSFFIHYYWRVLGKEPHFVLNAYMISLLRHYHWERVLGRRKKRLAFYRSEIRHFLPYVRSDNMVVNLQTKLMTFKSLSLLKNVIRKVRSYTILNNLLIMAALYKRHFLIEFLVRQGADDF